MYGSHKVCFVLYLGQLDRGVDGCINHDALGLFLRQFTHSFEAVTLAMQALFDEAPSQFSLFVFHDESVCIFHLSPLPFGRSGNVPGDSIVQYPSWKQNSAGESFRGHARTIYVPLPSQETVMPAISRWHDDPDSFGDSTCYWHYES
jgi:hypothetical protein